MSNITVTHADSGLVRVRVLRRETVTPHMTRVVFGGDDLRKFTFRGFDQWFRLALPVHDDAGFDRMPQRFGMAGYLRYLALPKDTRPVVRNYTVRDFRHDALEMDVDFLIHGSEGVAGPWAAAAEPGMEAAFIDQGCGWQPPAGADWFLIVADESGLPAVAGVLRDMPRDAVGHALVELFDERDRQPVVAPPGVTVHWLTREHDQRPGAAVLPAVEQLTLDGDEPYAFAVGESAVATGVRRHLVREQGVPKSRVTFAGYWKYGRPAM